MLSDFKVGLVLLPPFLIQRNMLGFSWVSSHPFPTSEVIIHHLSLWSRAWLVEEVPRPEVLSVCPHPHWTRISGAPFVLLRSKIFIGQFNFPGSWETHISSLFFLPPQQSSPPQQLLRMHLGLVVSVLFGKESSGALRSLSYNQRTAAPRPWHTVGLVGSVVFSHHWKKKLPLSKGCGLALGPCISPRPMLEEQRVLHIMT